ncbi:MAG: DNA topoisomerase I, partial [Armatimonadetes bacterium]|nr:DNA topoisomerase I [Armatimonadota bacterium]
ERVGLITYMRTDSLNLAERALTQAREVIRDLYGAEDLPNSPVRYRTKAKGAQEAHEAIRPTDLARRPQDVATYLDRDQQALYDLIWKRTLACQMLPAKVMRSTVEIEVKAGNKNLVFTSSGKEIVFPGFLRAYVEGSDDPESDLSDRETVLPAMKEGQELDLLSVEAQGHTTKPPARYTEASLIKNLEEEGVGRPSTYSSIISTIQDRGYVFKKGNELVPTWTAFAVTELLEQNFMSLVDLKFTAEMEGELDDIADGKRDWVKHLRGFYSGDTGLAHRVETEGKDIPFPAMVLGDDPSGNPVVVRVGRYGTFVQRGEGGKGHTANVPEEMAPAELNLALALEMIDNKASGPAALGLDPQTGRNVFYRKGRFGDYLEVEQTEEEIAAAEKPRRVTLPKDVKGNALSAEDLALLIQFPRNIGNHPDTGEPIMVQIGQYGPYVKSGTDIRNVEGWREAGVLTLQAAVELLSQPKYRSARGAGATPNIEPIKTLGEIPGCAGPVRVMAGRYGPYVTDGKTNATIPKGTTPDDITADEALQLILARAGVPKTKKKFARGKK